MIIKSAGKTDIGLVRKVNEDCINLQADRKLFIVCDGMGGHNAGEVASSTACNTVAALYGRFFDRLLNDDQISLPRVFPPSTDVLTKAVRIANHAIFKRSVTDPSLTGMGTTIVAVAIEQDIMSLLHVGDSRIYRFYNRQLTPLTVDHSWAAELEQSERISPEEARNLVNRNVITRALGVKESIEIDVAVRKIVEDEMYILCSDGLCGFVDDSDIKYVVAACNGDTEKVTRHLVQLANDRGGMDNVSVVALKITGKIDTSDLPELETVTVDAEPPEYYEAEENWATLAVRESPSPEETVAEGVDERRPVGRGFLFLVLVAIALAVVIYLIYKG